MQCHLPAALLLAIWERALFIVYVSLILQYKLLLQDGAHVDQDGF